MAKRKQYPLRIDSEVWDAVGRWAADDLRSVNAQVEFILRRSLKQAGRLGEKDDASGKQDGVPPKAGASGEQDSASLENDATGEQGGPSLENDASPEQGDAPG